MCAALLSVLPTVAYADNPDLIFKKTTRWKFLSPDSKIGTYGLDDPEVEGLPLQRSGGRWLERLARSGGRAFASLAVVSPIRAHQVQAQT